MSKKGTEIILKNFLNETSFSKKVKSSLRQERAKIKSNHLPSVKFPQININKQMKLKMNRNYDK